METNPTSNEMKRGEFLRSLGLSTAALMAYYCMGTSLTACSSKSSDPTPAPTTTPGSSTTTGSTTVGFSGNADPSKGAVNFTLDLTAADFKTLKTAGSYVYVSNIIVAFVSGNSYVAISKVCTHEGTAITYILTENDFYCPNHGSRFTNTGSVKNGPATAAVQQFKTSLSTDGTKLTVTA